MEIMEEVVEIFFQKLRNDKEFPDAVIEELKKILENNNAVTQAVILEAIKKGENEIGND